MTLTAGLAIYLVIWWTVLFAVLPWGIVSQHEEGAVTDGTDASAPVRPRLLRKALITTIIAAMLWCVVAYIYTYQPIGFDSIPFLPELHEWYGPADGQPAS
ncbi:MAG TPA: DUF1467 family protein [Parvibaculum sp.]|uniref:DUF1467 family protein n=1 Tax=Parvibaculum sp. TaxID=2024848 RepID=UPI002CE469B3|nr:DUF1467 family protein [Parvibaculum sp.]HMM14176.1 DUF1467 family protein [Parvibaculum sp.]